MNERFPMRRRSTRITLANTLVLAQGLLLFAGCAGESQGAPAGTAPGATPGSMTAANNLGAGGRPGTATAPVATPTALPPMPSGPTPGAAPPPASTPGMAPASGAGAVGTGMPAATPPPAGTDPAAAGGATPGASSCFDGVTAFDADGPFKFMKEMMGMVHLWIPMVPAGCKVPMVHYANGTDSTCQPNYEIMERLATHGFIGLCYDNPNTGAGTQAITAYETAMMMHGDMLDNKIGSMGHSQGGQAAFVAMQLAEEKWGTDKNIFAGLAVEPASGFGTQPMGGSWQSIYGKIKSPMFMFSGTMDNLVSEGWVQQAYSAMPKENEVYWYSAVGATHVPAPNRWQLAVSVPWFRWKLLGENEACKAFKALPDGDLFDKRMTQNEVMCK